MRSAMGSCRGYLSQPTRFGTGTASREWQLAPLLYDAGTAFTQLTLLTPFGVHRWAEVKTCWREQKRYVFGVALLSPVAYVLILTALSFTQVSYIAPAREISIVIGAFIGAKYLKEADGHKRLWAAAAMALGVIALALG